MKGTQAVIVGGGVMGEALLAAALDRGVFEPEDVTVIEKVDARRVQLKAAYGVEATADFAPMGEAGLVVLAVKPQELASVRGRLRPGALLLSIMAGVRIAAIEAAFDHPFIVRAMPNTPAAVKAGMTVWTAAPVVTVDQRSMARMLLGAVGKEVYVDDERKIDMATAVSGSGPAYVYLFIEALVEGAVAVGLPRAMAEELVLQTVYGSAVYAQESGKSAAELRAMVTSPSGTTAAGLLELERGALRARVIEAVRAAHARAVELGGGS
ncbi:pyrroline-5-carboxylate reductase [Tepidiforma sp.]|uniref:pyrroline-5-carboxylate reductase n=1 Tax=Tepidiforma sp. TaxID=2682230 RepID=UPI002ADDAD28|nr:pyrroline-5-carboxylate reductase [Tepidiforma sp.]